MTDDIDSAFEPDDLGEGDALAKKEAMLINSGGDIEADGKRKEHTRDQRFRDWLHYGILALLVFGIIFFIGGAVIYALHLFGPKGYHWLSPEQIEKIETILASVITTGALANYVSRRLK
ncbi:MAG: hypothetical protein R3E83_04540 [Burkholderiaceae bacterium]